MLWLRGPCLAVLLAVAALAVTQHERAAQATDTTFSNEQAIAINDSPSPPTKASLYPSRIHVSGISGVVRDVDVSLWGFSHDDPQNSDMLLVGPAGQAVRIMSDAAGDPALSNLNLTFDDEASGTVPFDTAVSGSYQPTNWHDSSSDSMASPAPAGPYASVLSTFDGTDPNGDWALYIVDDSSGRSGVIAGGWSLSINVNSAPVVRTVADATVDEAATLDIAISATDTDGDALSFSLAGAPAFVSLDDHEDGTGTLHVAPSYDDAGEYASITVTASDGALAHATTFDLTVNNVNRPPTANAGADIVIADWDGNGVETVTLNGSASSGPDHDIVSWVWSSNGSSVASGESANATFATGVHTLTLVVTDAYGATSSDTLTVDVRDVVAPTTGDSSSVEPSEFGWFRSDVTVNLLATDNTGGTGVKSITYSATGVTSIPVTTVNGDAASLTFSANGITTVSYVARDLAGNVEATRTLVVRIDKVAPRASAPTHKYKLPLKNSTTEAIQVTMAWSGSDQVSGIQRYEVEESVNGNAFHALTLGTPDAISKYRMLRHGRTYQFRVRSVDFAGNTSAWMTRAAFAVEASEQPSSKLTYAGVWNDAALEDAFGGTTRYSGMAGSRAVLKFNGSSVTVLAAMRSGSGKADVYLDGKKVATVDLYAKSAKQRQAVFARNNLNPNVNHTLEVRVLGQRNVSSKGTRVDIDEFIVLN